MVVRLDMKLSFTTLDKKISTISMRNIPINYFKDRANNRSTGACYTKIKMIKRVSFGFKNIDDYITKVTLAFCHYFLSLATTLVDTEPKKMRTSRLVSLSLYYHKIMDKFH